MNLHARMLALAVALLSASACAPLQKSTSRSASVPGSYEEGAATTDSRHAAAFAAREEGRNSGTPIRVIGLLKSESQIVAGTNFRLRIAAQRNGASTETADVVVYRDLFGHFHLTSWRWAGR